MLTQAGLKTLPAFLYPDPNYSPSSYEVLRTFLRITQTMNKNTDTSTQYE